MFAIEEFSYMANGWFQIAVADSEQKAMAEVKYLNKKNGNYYRYRQMYDTESKESVHVCRK